MPIEKEDIDAAHQATGHGDSSFALGHSIAREKYKSLQQKLEEEKAHADRLVTALEDKAQPLRVGTSQDRRGVVVQCEECLARFEGTNIDIEEAADFIKHSPDCPRAIIEDHYKRRETRHKETTVPELDDADLRVETFRDGARASNPVVVVTHLPTGITGTCKDERSYYKSRVAAMEDLKTNLRKAGHK